MTTCTFPLCLRRSVSRGLCGGHARQRDKDQPLRPLRSDPSVAYHDGTSWCVDLLGTSGEHRHTVRFDEADLALVRAHRWYAHVKRPYNYRYAATRGDTLAVALLHRMIMGLDDGDPREVDHEDGDRLNCRRGNLRLTTRAENAQNLGVRSDSKTGVRGVVFDQARGLYRAEVRVGGVRHFVGRFFSLEEAGNAASAKRLELMTHTNEARRFTQSHTPASVTR